MQIDLKLVLPLNFAGAGIWSTVRKSLMTETLPGWLDSNDRLVLIQSPTGSLS